MFSEHWVSVCFIRSNDLSDTIACREGSLSFPGNHSGFWATERLFQGQMCPSSQYIPPPRRREKTVSACDFLAAHASASTCLSETLYQMSKTEKKLLWLPSPLYFSVSHPKKSSSGLLSAGRPWSGVEVDVAVGSAPGRLLFALPWKPALPLPGGIRPAGTKGSWRDPSLPSGVTPGSPGAGTSVPTPMEQGVLPELGCHGRRCRITCLAAA